MASCSLPYFADAESLPATLPESLDIESATEIFGDTTGRKVVGVGTHFVVKYGVQVDPLEGQTMVFLAQSTTIPVPRVYAIFQAPSQDTTTTYIIMECISGSPLIQSGPRMNHASKTAVISQLRHIFAELRKVPSPGGYCSVGRGRLPDGLFWTPDPAKPYAAPFDTEADLNRALILKYKEQGVRIYKASYCTRAFAGIFRDHEPTFSHGDFQRKNVVVRNPNSEHPEVGNDRLGVCGLVSELLGLYPGYLCCRTVGR